MQNQSSIQEMQEKVQKFLGEEITQFSFFAKGAVNNTYLVETNYGEKYIVKQEKEIKEFQPQNTLLVEACVAQKLGKAHLSVPVSDVVFISEDPVMYGYHYIGGDLMVSVWNSLTHEERIAICHSLGIFHAELGKKITKESAVEMGVLINDSIGLHPETIEEYNLIIKNSDVPDEWKSLAQYGKKLFDATSDKTVFQFIHNDAHHENIIIQDKKIVGIIDFGNAEYGEIAKEFSRYIRDFPDYFQYIVSSYEEASGNKLSYERLVGNAFVSGLVDIVESYKKGGNDKIMAENTIKIYQNLLNKLE